MSAPPLDSLGDNASRSYGQPGASPKARAPSERPASAQLRARAAVSSSQPVLRTKLPDEHEHEHEQADWSRRTKKPVPLCSLAPPWWVMPPEAVQAARKFDVGLVALSGRVERLHTTLEEDPTHTLAEECLGVAMRELYRHRYFVPELAAKAAGKIKIKQKPKKKWRLEESIWARRVRTSDSKAFLDSDECERARFEIDWQEALSHKLEGFIIKTDKKEKGAPPATRGGARGGQAGGDAPAPGCHPEVLEVRDVLWEHHDQLYMTFFYYASQENKPNVFMINYLSYQRFYEDCSLAVAGSIGCQPRNLDQMFVAINASGKGTEHAKEKHNDQHSLNRQEFLQLLVRVAYARYIMTGQVHDVSDAVRMVVEQDVLSNVAPECLHDLNTFREHYCYLEEVDHVLRRHETSLRALYKEFSKDLDPSRVLEKTYVVMGYDEWIGFLQSVHVIDMGFGETSTQFCSHRHGTLAFVWSRMAVIGSEEDDAVVLKTQNLLFEDFLEALVRVSTMVGWPTDAEIEEAGYTDAGEFLLNLRQFSNVYDRFMATHATSWDQEPRQPIERCVDHLIAWIIRVVAAAG